MKVVICLDRDGTLIHDEKYHLGRQEDWKAKIKLLPGVVEGIKILRKIPNSVIYLLTNQPGIAVEDFPLLSKERAEEVCEEVLKILKREGAKLEGYFLCPHANPKYVKKRAYKFHKKLVCECECIKPRPGMVKQVLKAEKIDESEAKIYVVGDRVTDVKTALNIGGTGVFVPFEKEPGEKQKVKKIKKGEVHIAKNFIDAAKFIYKKESHN